MNKETTVKLIIEPGQNYRFTDTEDAGVWALIGSGDDKGAPSTNDDEIIHDGGNWEPLE